MARIAIFDSGVGGLSIHAALVKRLPEHEYLFVSDNEAHPYGTKPDDFLIPRVESVVQKIVDKHCPDIIVIACNTASTVVLPSLRRKHSIAIVGVVPAIKPAAKITKTKHITVLGTPATIERPYTLALIDEFAADCSVLKLGSSLLVELAENKLRGQALDLSQIKRELEPILENDLCDVVVLACTHFPLLNNEISSVLELESPLIKRLLIDSGEAIARRVESLISLPESNLKVKHRSASGACGAWMTREISHQETLIKALETRQLPYLGLL